MKVAHGVEMLEISANVMGQPSIINPTLIWDNETAILVDAGYPGQLPQIEEAVERAGIGFDKISRVILTHQDIDHIGSVLSIKAKLIDRVKILAHEEESPYIQGDKCPLKLEQLESKLEVLPVEMKMVYERLKAGFQSSKSKVDITLKDGEELPYCGGISVIHTPGHTPGHICLYLKQSKILIAGDMLGVEGGVLVPSPKNINFDQNMYLESLEKIAQYDIQSVICYYGGLFRDNVAKCITELK